MMSVRVPAAVAVLLAVVSVGVRIADGAPAGSDIPVTKPGFVQDPGEFQFVIVADRTGGHRPGVFGEAMEKVNLLKPEFVMCVGDLMECYSKDEAEIHKAWDEFDALVGRLEMPFYYVPGNHDITNRIMARIWAERRGASYYHFVYKDVLFLCLNTDDHEPGRLSWKGEPGRLSGKQIRYVADALAGSPDVRWTLVFMHKPLWEVADGQENGWREVESLLQDRPYTVFAGHEHRYFRAQRNGRNYIRLATTGAGSSLSGAMFGEFDHVTWITMTDDGPRLANLEPAGIHDENVVNEEYGRVLDEVNQGSSFEFEPMLIEQDVFLSGVTRAGLTNNTDYPMSARALILPHRAVRAKPYLVDEVLPPHSSRTVQVALEAQEPVEVDGFEPITVEWSYSHEIPERGPMTRKGVWNLRPEVVRSCLRASSDVVVDGTLGEWGELPIACREPAEFHRSREAWSGPEDCSFRFATTHDDNWLYIAVETTDDASVLGQDKRFWKRDGIEVDLMTLAGPNVALVVLTPGERADAMVWSDKGRSPEGTQAVCVKTETGYVTEIAVPMEYLRDETGKALREFRMNIAVVDLDRPDGPATQIWWRPNWRSSLTYPGSGTFRLK